MGDFWKRIKITVWWNSHVDAKFKTYERMWEKHYRAWQSARARGDDAAMLDHFEQQALYLRAEQLAHMDMDLPFSQRDERWDADYVAEARGSLSTSPNRKQRLDAIDKIMRESRRVFANG